MKKFLLVIAILLVIGGGAVLYLKRGGDDEAPLSAPTGNNTQSNTPPPSAASANYKDGSYTGTTVEADGGYGPVQVKAVISGSKITDIVFLQMPSALGHSQEVTAFSEPLLKQEAIASQNSQVDIVSGATQTSMAFQQSLASALAQAK